jgi:ornithine carbamoyltransferase
LFAGACHKRFCADKIFLLLQNQQLSTTFDETELVCKLGMKRGLLDAFELLGTDIPVSIEDYEDEAKALQRIAAVLVKRGFYQEAIKFAKDTNLPVSDVFTNIGAHCVQ